MKIEAHFSTKDAPNHPHLEIINWSPSYEEVVCVRSVVWSCMYTICVDAYWLHHKHYEVYISYSIHYCSKLYHLLFSVSRWFPNHTIIFSICTRTFITGNNHICHKCYIALVSPTFTTYLDFKCLPLPTIKYITVIKEGLRLESSLVIATLGHEAMWRL